jgi:hypothetical protein
MATDADKTVQSNTRSTDRKAAATKRSTTAKKAAATRQSKRTSAASKRTSAQAKRTTRGAARTAQTRATAAERAAEREARTTLDRVGDAAEKAVLTYVGAALSARDNVVDTVGELRATYGTRAKTERQLRKVQRSLETDLRRFERRGTTARNQLEREVKRARTRVERQLREQRRSLRGAVRTTPPAPDTLVRNAKAQADFVSARVGNAVETAQLAGATAVAKVSERVASLA